MRMSSSKGQRLAKDWLKLHTWRDFAALNRQPISDRTLLAVMRFARTRRTVDCKRLNLNELQDLESTLDDVLKAVGNLLLRLHGGNFSAHLRKQLSEVLLDKEDVRDMHKLRHAVSANWSKLCDFHKIVEWRYDRGFNRVPHLKEEMACFISSPHAAFPVAR